MTENGAHRDVTVTAHAFVDFGQASLSAIPSATLRSALALTLRVIDRRCRRSNDDQRCPEEEDAQHGAEHRMPTEPSTEARQPHHRAEYCGTDSSIEPRILLNDTTMAGSLPDILQRDLKVVFCGINPGQSAAESGLHFLGRGNRFWKALHLAGFTPTQFSPSEAARLLELGFGLTVAVPRATRSAVDVGAAELRSGLRDLETKLRRLKPRVVAMLGKSAWTVHAGSATFEWGRQPQPFASSEAWVLPNPSGLNRGFSLDELVVAYRELRLSLDSSRPRGLARKPR